MGQLSIYLPPFSGDYSGVCSALFDLNCLIIINDASCCTRNYVSFDEPRWTLKKKTTLCSELRSIDAILGDDEKLIGQIVEAAQKLNPEFIAVLGSPVPAIIGTDMKGIAQEIEARTGCPTLGFNTTGFSYYNKGVEAAFLALMQRFTYRKVPSVANGVNILGLTTMDFSANNNSIVLRKLLEESGLKVICSFFMQFDLEQVRQAASAEVNLVVSQSGLSAARYMQQQFDIPYVVAAPMGYKHSQTVIKALQQTVNDKENRVIKGNLQEEGNNSNWLIIGDQVVGNSLRSALQEAGCKSAITVASFFGFEQEIALPGDMWLKSERHLIETIRSGKYHSLLADPLIAEVPDAAVIKCHTLPHPAVSSNLYWNKVPLFISDEMENLLRSWAG